MKNEKRKVRNDIIPQALFANPHIVILCLFFLITGGLSAQTAQELRIDTIVSGTIAEGGEYWYSVRTPDAGLLTVETMGSTDTHLAVYDASRNFIDFNDDGGDNTNARITILTEAGRTYLFKLSGYNNTESGAYRIFATYEPMPQTTELRYNAIVSGTVRSDTDEIWYSVRPAQSGYVTVETMGSADTVLTAYNSFFVYLDYDDDSGEGYNARLKILVEAGKTYFFVLSGYISYGPYRIFAAYEPFPQATELPFDSMVSGTISAGGEYWYSVWPTQNGYVEVETMGSTDTYVEAFDSSYIRVGYDDDSGDGYNARLAIPVEAGKTYFFKLSVYGGDGGAYRIYAVYFR